MYVYMYAPMYVCMFVRMYARHTYVCMHACMLHLFYMLHVLHMSMETLMVGVGFEDPETDSKTYEMQKPKPQSLKLEF